MGTDLGVDGAEWGTPFSETFSETFAIVACGAPSE